MLKVLSLLIILANLLLLMWEYRSGAFTPAIKEHTQIVFPGKESIVLWNELNNRKPSAENSDGSN